MKIPFNRISLQGKEQENIAKAIENGALQGDGFFTKSCEKKIEKITGAKTALLTNSGTAALDIAAILCDIREGDEVIVPTYTFVSSVNAFVLRGAKPVFCDVHPETLNIDETKIEELITPKTKVIVPVHYAGVACEMDEICAIAKRHNLIVVEDAAQAFNATYKGKPLGTIGQLGALSFHGTKNVIAGEGGALLVNDESLRDRAFYVREKGTNRIKFIEGKIDKYTWVDIGDSYIPSELVAAFLDAQLEATDALTKPRVEAWNRYYNALESLADAGKITLAKVPQYCEHNAHIFFFSTRDATTTKELSAFLKERGIAAIQHYAPLHNCPMAEELGCPKVTLPVAESMAKTMLRLPIFASITQDEQAYICQAIFDFFKSH